MNGAFVRSLILQHTKLTRQHLTPELKLHLITPQCPLWSAQIMESPFDDPFWAFYWPGGQVLTRYILDNPRLFEAKTILDVGSGSGSVALASKMVGAKSVIANDVDLAALIAIEMNMESNIGTGIDNIFLDGRDCFSQPLDKSVDCVFMGDMFYDPDFADVIGKWLKSVNFERTDLFIGDPGRLSFNNHPLKRYLMQVAEYKLSTMSQLENNGFSHGYVWRYNRMLGR